MALLWSKKPKAETNYSEETRKLTSSGKPAKGKAMKGEKATAAPKTKAVAMPSGHFDDAAGAIIRPHITEKSGLLSQAGTYTFQVAAGANKAAVAKAVKTLYKVTPVKVAVINLPAKKIFVKGRIGTVSAMRKAMVTLKKGEKIDFV